MPLLTRPATLGALWLIAVGCMAFVGWEYARGYAAAQRGEAPLYTDYTSLYAASLLARDEPAENLYRPRRMYEATVATAYLIYGDRIAPEQARQVGFSPWLYPPTFILFSLPLAFLPYLPSLLLWLGATAIPYLAAMRTILRDGSAFPLALAAPPAFFNIAYGQTGFLSGGLIGLGLALIPRRPALAGILLGLASFKPHLGVLIPLALAAGGQWRVFGGAVAGAVGLALLSIVLLGDDPWFGFIGSMLSSVDGFAAGAYTWGSMTSILSTLHVAGASLDAAWRGQYAVAAAVALIVAWAWRRGRRHPDTAGLQAALLCFGTPLVVPMVYLYDLVVIVPGVAWLWLELRARNARPWEVAALAAAFGLLLPAFLIASRAGLPIGALCVAALFGLALRRYWHALKATGRNAARP